MARARNIKPGIMENEELADIDPFARLLFIYLWMLADCEGRLEDRPKRIKAQALPYDNIDIDSLLSALASKRFIARYQVEGQGYIQVLKFVKHQYVTKKEKDAGSSLPAFTPNNTDFNAVSGDSCDSSVPVLNQFKAGTKPARSDKLNTDKLNTDKLNTDTSLEGSKGEESNSAPEEKPTVESDAEKVFDFIIQERKRKFGSCAYKIKPTHLQHIKARLKEGYAVEDLKTVFAFKLKDPAAKTYADYVTPFRETNFQRYLDQARLGARASPIEKSKTPPLHEKMTYLSTPSAYDEEAAENEAAIDEYLATGRIGGTKND